MGNPAPLWKLEGFLERLDAWVDREKPSDDVRIAATAWILTRPGDPYQGVKRDKTIPNYWYGAIPRSGDDAGHVVVCCYWIEELRKTLRCDSFATLSLPIL